MRRKEWIVQFFSPPVNVSEAGCCQIKQLGTLCKIDERLHPNLFFISKYFCHFHHNLSMIVPPVHRHPRSLEQLPPPSRPVKQLWELTIVSKLPQIVVLSFCLHLMFNLVDPVDIFYLLYRDPHVPIWVPFLQATLMLKSWQQGHPKMWKVKLRRISRIQFPVLCTGFFLSAHLKNFIKLLIPSGLLPLLEQAKCHLLWKYPKNLWFQYWMHCHLEIEISLSFYPTGMEVRLALT